MLHKIGKFFIGSIFFFAILVAPVDQKAWAIGGNAPIDSRRFLPAFGTEKILTVDLANVGPHLQITPQLFFHYAYRPVVFSQANYPDVNTIQHQLNMDASIAISLLDRIQLGIAMPVTWYQSGETASRVGLPSELTPPGIATIGAGDMRFSMKTRIWNNETFGFGAAADLAVPTGNADSFLGSKYPTANVRLIGHLKYKRLTLGLQLGWLFASEEKIISNYSGMGLTFGLGAQVELYRNQKKDFSIYGLAEFTGTSHVLSYSKPDSVALNQTPMQANIAAKAKYKDWTFFAGVTTGVPQAIGEAPISAFVGASWSWSPKKKPVQTAPVVELPPPPPEPIKVKVTSQRLVLKRIEFNFDDVTITQGSQETLDHVVTILQQHPQMHLRLDGHTDARGSDFYNNELSERRVQAIKTYLISKGIEADRIDTTGCGKRHLLIPDATTEQQHEDNRRVEFVITIGMDGQPNPNPLGVCGIPSEESESTTTP